ncbi:putative olfactory receptor 7A2 [Lampetra fluviatilis]
MELDDSFIMLGTFEASDGVRMFAFSLTLLLLVVTVTANLLVLAIVAARTQLHVPMYVLMCNLLVADVVGGAVSFPQQLYVFLTGDLRISRASCIAQMFWINVFVDLESLTLAAMSLDRYVAICHPLRYHAVVTGRRALLAVVTTWFITVAILVPQTLLVSRLKLRATDREIQGSLCDFSGYIRLSVSDTKVQDIFGSSALFVFIALPLCVIAYTYFRIIRECKRTGQSEFKRKAVHTLLTHFLMLAMFFVACFVSTMVPRLVKDFQYSKIKNLRCGVQLLTFIIPIANVSIYFVRNKKLRREMVKCFKHFNPRGVGRSRSHKVCNISPGKQSPHGEIVP